MASTIRKIRFRLMHTLRSFLYRRFLRKHIKEQISKIPNFYVEKKDKKYLNECKHYLEKNFSGYSNTQWHHLYSTINGIKDTRYIPDEIYFGYVDPLLNNYDHYLAYMDKISFDFIFHKENIPKTVLRIINYRFFDENNKYLSLDEACNHIKKWKTELVIKPAVDTSGGNKVVVDFPERIIKLLSEKPMYKSNSFIIQEKIIQHPALAAFHPRSVNSLRIMTANLRNKTVVLSSYIKMGRDSMRVDNSSAGGIICGINNDGTLKKYAFDQALNRYKKHPNTNISFEGYLIPGFQKALDYCICQHRKILRLTFISWDIAIDPNAEPTFIELNFRRQIISTHQVTQGPLFGDYTDEIIELYNYERKKDPIFH